MRIVRIDISEWIRKGEFYKARAAREYSLKMKRETKKFLNMALKLAEIQMELNEWMDKGDRFEIQIEAGGYMYQFILKAPSGPVLKEALSNMGIAGEIKPLRNPGIPAPPR